MNETRVAILGPFGPPQIASMRVFSNRGIPAVFLHSGEGPEPRLSQQVLAGYQRLPADLTDMEDGAELLARALDWHRATHLISVGYGQSRWAADAIAETGSEVVPCTPAPETYDFLEGKAEQIALAREVGFDLLPTYELEDSSGAAAIPDGDFPLVLRPDGHVQPSFKIEKIDSRTALERFLQGFAPGFRIVAQPYTPGPNVIMQGARAVDGRQMRHAAFLADFKYKGVTQRLRPIETPPGLEELCSEFVRRAGITGAYHFDVLRDQESGRNYFLEINGRLGGTTNKVRCCGYEQPLYMLAAYGGAPWQETPPPRLQRKVSNRFSVLKRLAELSRSNPDPLDYPTGPKGPLVARLTRGLVTWTDENVSLHNWQLTADYHRQMLSRH